ncbi:MAG TPA: phosphotransferase [Thermoanaerobaculia bacterium]|jgi:aminoglycoside/choline kinase family phosphotransferase
MTEPIEAATGPARLEAWLAATVPGAREVQPLPGDVSPRRYFRVVFDDGATAILATYPPEVRATCPRFLRTTEILGAAGVRVPRVLASDCAAGWMLVEDLGPDTLGDWGRGRPWSELAGPFEHALELADRISRLSMDGLAELNPRLGGELLARELAQTWDLFLVPRELVAEPTLATDLRAALDTLCATLGAEPPVPCHRDFMVRNLMPLPGSGSVSGLGAAGLAVLDHQDLRLGPPLYDLASLLNDTLFPLPEAEAALLRAALPAPADQVRYHRAAAQRTLKAVGTYAKFALQGANRHLPLIAPTLARFVNHFSQVPEGEPLAARLAESWSPVLGTPGSGGSARLTLP